MDRQVLMDRHEMVTFGSGQEGMVALSLGKGWKQVCNLWLLKFKRLHYILVVGKKTECKQPVGEEI